jgi:hypothetical protein
MHNAPYRRLVNCPSRATIRCPAPHSSPPAATDRSPAAPSKSFRWRPAAKYPPVMRISLARSTWFWTIQSRRSHPALLVLGTCLVFALQSVNFQGLPGTVLLGHERFVSVLFVSEYFLRRYGCNPRFLLTRSAAMLVDFCAITLPTGLAGWLPAPTKMRLRPVCALSEIRPCLSAAASYVKRGTDNYILGRPPKLHPHRECAFPVYRIFYTYLLVCLTYVCKQVSRSRFWCHLLPRVKASNISRVLLCGSARCISSFLVQDWEKDVDPAISYMFDPCRLRCQILIPVNDDVPLYLLPLKTLAMSPWKTHMALNACCEFDIYTTRLFNHQREVG